MVCSGINPPAYGEVENYLRRQRQTDLESFLDSVLDIASVAPQYVGPSLRPGEDIWGVVRGPSPSVRAVMMKSRTIRWPRRRTLTRFRTCVADHRFFRLFRLPARIAAMQKKRCLMISKCEPYSRRAWYMRGFERMLMDFTLNPELAHGIMERVTDFHVEHFRKTLEAADGSVDLAFTADDVAGQNGLLLSLKMWEELTSRVT